MYPVVIVADATRKRHYYMAVIASDGMRENTVVDKQTTNNDPTIARG